MNSRPAVKVHHRDTARQGPNHRKSSRKYAKDTKTDNFHNKAAKAAKTEHFRYKVADLQDPNLCGLCGLAVNCSVLPGWRQLVSGREGWSGLNPRENERS